jgi:hypothetical protein
MERAMKYSRSQPANLVALWRALFVSTQCALVGGLLLASSISLRAQQLGNVPRELTSRNQTSEVSVDGVEANSSLVVSDPDNGARVEDPAVAQSASDAQAAGERLRIYELSYLSPQSDIGPLLGAAVNQAIDFPRGWGRAGGSFGRRVASLYGQDVVGRTISFGVAALDHEDPRFYPSHETRIWKRTEHAVIATFVSKTPSGGDEPAFSRFAGVYGAAAIGNAWEPMGQRGPGHVVENGSIALAASIGWHVFGEFWPDIRNRLHRHRQ